MFIFYNNNNNYLKCWLTLQFSPYIKDWTLLPIAGAKNIRQWN